MKKMLCVTLRPGDGSPGNQRVLGVVVTLENLRIIMVVMVNRKEMDA